MVVPRRVQFAFKRFLVASLLCGATALSVPTAMAQLSVVGSEKGVKEAVSLDGRLGEAQGVRWPGVGMPQ